MHMEHLHQYRRHIYSFVLGLAVVTLGISVYSYFYNPTEAQVVTSANPYEQEATTDPSTWKGVNVPLQLTVLNQSLISQVAAVGANVIRLDVHSDPAGVPSTYIAFTDSNGNVLPVATNPGIIALKQIVTLAAQYNIKVIIDMHSLPGVTNASIWTNQADWNTAASLWSTIATTFKNNPNVVAFDLMNEPNVLNSLDATTKASYISEMNAGTWSIPAAWIGTPRDYNAEIAQIITAVRSADPSRTVIVEGIGESGSPINYNWMTPIAGFSNVVYSFHMYIPSLTTIATGSQVRIPFLYPSEESKVTNALAPVIAFQQKYNVPIYVGEFGLDTDAVFGTDPSKNNISYNGSCWMSYVMSAIDSHHWGWTFWNFWPGDITIPVSNIDPRYVLLNNDMTKGIVPDFCNNSPTLNSAVTPLPTIGPTVTTPVDNTPPTILFNGSNSMTLTVGDTFVDPGATATDPVDGNITSSITTTGSVDTNTAGVYTLTYSVTDSAGNSASAVRTITVNPPVSTTSDDDSYVVSSPSSSGVSETVSHPLTGSVSGSIQFDIQPTAPVVVTTVTTTATPSGTKTVTTTSPVVTSPTVKAIVATTKTTTTSAPTTPTKSVTISSNPVVASDATQASTTLTSIVYTLDSKVIHTSTSFPDVWNFDTTNIPNGAYNLTATYHYANGTTESSITIFTVKNGQTFVQNITGILKDVWQELLTLLGKK
jgi:hypothetical protein